jgi:hypothetical protein
MTAAARRRRRNTEDVLDVDLIDLPAAARWREWRLRVEAAIFASAKPVSREALVRVVGENCRFDDLIADLIHKTATAPTTPMRAASTAPYRANRWLRRLGGSAVTAPVGRGH